MGLAHPIAIASLALLLVNDHVLKAAYPGWTTGKLSDLAGMVVFPLLLRSLAGRWLRHDPLVACVVATGLGFTAVKLWEPATRLCELVLGALQWPFHVITAGHVLPLAPVEIVRDPTDLLALPMLAVAWWIGRRRATKASPTCLVATTPTGGTVARPSRLAV